jgi:hypothetical protein
VVSPSSQEQRRGMASSGRPGTRGATKQFGKANESDWQQRTELFSFDMSEEYKSYPLVTAEELKSRKERPRKVKMLMRDFIDGGYLLMRPKAALTSQSTNLN